MSKYTGEAAFSKANQWYRDKGEALMPKTRAIQDIATEGVNTLIKTLAPLGEFDYSRFQGLASSSARLLAMAGLDPKRLPAMNNRDKGRALEDVLVF